MQKEKKLNTRAGTETKILDLVSTESRFTKLNQAIKVAGLTERFSSQNNFTVFAPTNEAFAKLPQTADLLKTENQEELRKLLLLHIVPGALLTEDLKKAKALKTEAGRELNVSVSQDAKEIKLGNAKVMLPTEKAKNGILYPLDNVLQPANRAASAA